MSRRRPFFRGSEFSRWLLLAAVMAGGWIWVLFQAQPPLEPAPRPPRVAQLTHLPPPDDAPEFQGIQDRYWITARDTPAYALLFRRVRETPYTELASQSRRDVLFPRLLDDPARFRGLPIHFEGVARRVIRQEKEDSKLVASGVYFEAYAVSPDSIKFPWVLAFEQAPPELLIGDDLDQPITFDGFFLKLWAYRDGEGRLRVAPILVGRFPPALSPSSQAKPRSSKPARAPWLTILLSVLTLYLGTRLVLQLRRNLNRQDRPRGKPRVSDEIAPEALNAWVESEAGENVTRHEPDPGESPRE